jgi:hypothetical protein
MSYQLFISGGCSASFTHPSYKHRSWPVHVAQQLGCEHLDTALPAQGNGMISRRVMYAVEQALKSHSAADILVGVVWSGSDRLEFYNDQSVKEFVDQTHWGNPTSLDRYDPSSKTNKNWILINPHYTKTYSETYYRMFHNSIDSVIKTCEHVLRTQWYLQKHSIRYFMSTFTQETFHKSEHPEVAWLYDQIDHGVFLPVKGIYEWATESSGMDFETDDLMHPTSAQHQLFTEKVIWPFLKEKIYV